MAGDEQAPTAPPPRVSIITGIYNSIAYLPHYVHMLQQQTFADFEVLLVDDGSTDESCAWLQRFCRTDPRFHLLRKSPEGFPSRSRAVGLAAARAPFVAFCDHDDFWAPQKLEMQMQVLAARPNIAILHTDRIVWQASEPPRQLFWYDAPLATIPIHRDRPEDVIYQGLRIIFSSFIGPRELIQKVGFHPDMRGVDDFYLFVRLGLIGEIYRIDLPLTYYYAHAGNLSHAQNLFVRGFYQVHAALVRDGVPQIVQNSILAQACRTEAVTLLATDRPKALRLMIRSLRLYFIPSTLNRLVFLLVTCALPLPLQRRLLQWVKVIKFKLPTWRDVLRKLSRKSPTQ